MSYFFTGENSFELERELEKQSRLFDGLVENIDVESLSIQDLPNIFQGQTLFSDKRMVIIKYPSENRTVWEALPTWLDRLSDDTTLILVEPKPDKRTKTYKEITKRSTVKEFTVWSQRQTNDAVEWAIHEAKRQKFALTTAHAKHLVERTGLDHWRLFHGIEKLALVDELTIERIDEVIEPHPDESIFMLLDTALQGDISRVQRMLLQLRQTTDAYQTFGLLSSQIMQLAALVFSEKQPSQVAKDIGAHPFVLSKLASHAARASHHQIKYIIDVAANSDMLMKSTGHDPWVMIEELLIKIARR